MSAYNKWGFSENPFQTTVLPASHIGEELLVGREDELATLRQRIANPPRMPTLEGPNGVGKSSLVNVAAYQCYRDFLKEPDLPMYIPCRAMFQLSPEMELEEFKSHVYREVIQTLLEQARIIEGDHIVVDGAKAKLDRWLNSPELKSFEGFLGPVGGGYSAQQNVGEGYTKSGFSNAVRDWLNDIFVGPQSGGIICVIDNLELLETSDAARKQLEALRDEILNVSGLRWVLCGALGIVLGVASSPRLEGFLTAPIELGGIDKENVVRVFEARIRAYSKMDDPYLPLRSSDFERLHEVLAHNLRSLLRYSDEYCQWIAEAGGDLPVEDDEKARKFDAWLTEASRQSYDSAKAQLKPRAWRVFEDAVAVDGFFSPSDYELFDFNSVPAFRPHVKDLESAGLVVSTQDEGDRRRKTIQITPKGWLVQEHLR